MKFDFNFQFPRRHALYFVLIFFLLLNVFFWAGGPRVKLFFQRIFITPSDSWAAVYLVNGEVYVGHIKGTTSYTLYLTNSYLLNAIIQDEKDVSLNKISKNQFSLFEWGHFQPLKSSGSIYISRANVLFWEPLDNDAEVVKQLKGFAQKTQK